MIKTTDEFKELERQRHFAELNRVTALDYARSEGYNEAEEKWQGVVAEKDKLVTEKDALIAQLQAQLAEAKSRESEDEAAFI